MSTEVFKNIQTLIKNVGILGKVQVNSSLNPLLWLLALFLFFFIAVLFKTEVTWLIVFLCIVLALILLLISICFIYFMLKKPDYLRSESYQLHKYSIEKLGEKGREKDAIQVIEGETETINRKLLNRAARR